MEQSSFRENENPVEYLYLDKHRIASLIGQLSDKGVLTGLKSGIAKTINTEGQAGGSIPGVAQVGGRRSRTSNESAEETYDPFWTNAFGFLRDLESNFAVGLDDARFGNLVKFDAVLQFVDLRLMKSLWEPVAQAFLKSQSPVPNPSLPHKKQREMKRELSSETKFGLEVLKEMPHLLHMTFLAPSEGGSIFKFWAAMKPEFLTISSEDLTMKYGAVIDGKWTVIGIIDARIGDSPDALPVNDLLDGVIKALVNVRGLLGRPKDHWGLTPIAIYTPMVGIAENESQG